MFKRNQLYVSLIATSMILGTATAVAQESTTSSASVVVQNAFDITEVAPLDFGIVRATVDSDPTDDAGSVSVASFAIGADGSIGVVGVAGGATTAAAISVIADGAPAEFAITNAAPFTDIDINTITGFDLVNSAAAPGTGVFGVDSFVFREAGATSDGTSVTTDINGEINFTMGATLSTDDATAAVTNYSDGTYTSTFVMEVQY